MTNAVDALSSPCSDSRAGVLSRFGVRRRDIQLPRARQFERNRADFNASLYADVISEWVVGCTAPTLEAGSMPSPSRRSWSCKIASTTAISRSGRRSPRSISRASRRRTLCATGLRDVDGHRTGRRREQSSSEAVRVRDATRRRRPGLRPLKTRRFRSQAVTRIIAAKPRRLMKKSTTKMATRLITTDAVVDSPTPLRAAGCGLTPSAGDRGYHGAGQSLERHDADVAGFEVFGR